jgi:hypothetical protein
MHTSQCWSQPDGLSTLDVDGIQRQQTLQTFKAANRWLDLEPNDPSMSLACAQPIQVADSIGWSRVSPPLSTLAELKRVKRAGLDLLIATGLTLISGGLLKLAQDPLFKSTALAMLFLILHQLALAVGLLIGWMALSTLLSQAVNPAVDS